MAIPAPLNGFTIPQHVADTYDLIRSNVSHGLALLGEEEVDILRMKMASDNLEELEDQLDGLRRSGVPIAWFDQLYTAVHDTMHDLKLAAENVLHDDDEPLNVVMLKPVQTVRRPGRGRPRKEISLWLLRKALGPSRKIRISRLAQALGVHRNTLRARLKEHNVNLQFAAVSPEDLDEIIRGYRQLRPDSGLSYLLGYLRTHGMRVQRKRVRDSVQRVDYLGSRQRAKKPIKRRVYQVKRPGALWHLDGHHKLGPYGIVKHGIADGCSHKIMSLKVSNSNKSRTVLRYFRLAVRKYGVPSRVRGDRGGENLGVAKYMLLKRGINRASFMFGSSTHNTRIERIWLEVGREFGRHWRAFFQRLETAYFLDKKNPHHLWLLSKLFLNEIQEDCDAFRKHFNRHGIKGDRTKSQTPNDMYLLGQLEHGVTRPGAARAGNDWSDVDPNDLFEGYGVDREPIDGDTSESSEDFLIDHGDEAGLDVDAEAEQIMLQEGLLDAEEDNADWESSSSMDSDSDSDGDDLHQRVQRQLNHKAVKVPRLVNPFASKASERTFWENLRLVQEDGLVPQGYGFSLDEESTVSWNETAYLTVGKRQRSAKNHKVSLPWETWIPRAVAWVQALEGLMAATE